MILIRVLFIMLFATLLAALGSFLLKKGTTYFPDRKVLALSIVMGGLAGYGFGAILNIIAYKWGNLSITYPLTSLAYIWSFLLAYFFLDERLNIYKLTGVLCIIIGIFIIGGI